MKHEQHFVADASQVQDDRHAHDYYEDDYMIEPPPQKRVWIYVVAIIVPIVAFAGGAAWFIRAYVAPPMISIAEPLPMPGPALASASSTEVEKPAVSEPASSSVQNPEPAPAPMSSYASLGNLPVFTAPVATLGSSPIGTLGSAPTAEPMNDATVEPGTPIAEPVPLPLRRPRISLALVRGPVPLPRPRPSEVE